jgi:threonine/homoserine/homoserine lactone efflux protein
MTEALLKGLTLGFILALSVGPVIFTIIKQSLNNGRQGGFSFVFGVWLSDIVLVVLSNWFSELVSGLLPYKKMIGLVGSIFLISMGVIYLFFKKAALITNGEGEEPRFRKRDFLKIFSSGFFINTLNPNVFIFWLGTATAFAGKYSFYQRMIIFAVAVGLNMVADVFKVLLAGRLRSKLTAHNISIVNKISGTILIGFGIALLWGAIFFSNKL